jgi:hypothetical protein
MVQPRDPFLRSTSPERRRTQSRLERLDVTASALDRTGSEYTRNTARSVASALRKG